MNGANAKAGECRYCSKKIKKKCNLDRHEEETCLGIRITCVCGMKLRKSSLKRHHMKCDVYRKAEATSTSLNTHEIRSESETTTMEQHATMNEVTHELQNESTESYALNEVPIVSEAKISDQHSQNEITTCVTLQTNVRVTKKCDGTTSYEHDPIEINGIPMILVPASMVTIDIVDGK